MNIKRVLFGEPMPDKDDPKHKERYEKNYEAGRKFGEAIGVDKFAGWLQRKGDAHRKAFLIIVFGFVLLCFGYNLFGIIRAYQYEKEHGGQRTAVEQQDSILSEIIQNRKNSKP